MFQEVAELILAKYSQKRGAIPLSLLLQILILIVKALLEYAAENNMSKEQLIEKAKNFNFIERGVVQRECSKLIASADTDNIIKEDELANDVLTTLTTLPVEKALRLLKEAELQLI